jgi:signal transduction histidine kinase
VLEHAYELDMVRKDGISMTGLISVAVSVYEGRAATIGFLRDITERKRVQRSLWLSQRLSSIGKLAAEIAHEMNNPLTSVLTFSRLMERIIGSDPLPTQRLCGLQKYIGPLISEATRCREIARNLLDFSRQGDLEIKENDIHEILEKTLEILRHRAQITGIEIITSYAQDVPLILCDFKRLQQAFVNILWNAVEAMPEGGKLSVASALNHQDEMIIITISDTGVGVTEEHIESIFEPFFTTKDEGKGVGLGLSVAYGIINQHKGRIMIQSEVGKGTRCTIQLPAGHDPVAKRTLHSRQ